MNRIVCALALLLLPSLGGVSLAMASSPWQRLLPVDFEKTSAFGRSLDVENGWAVIGGNGEARVFQRDFPLPGQWGQTAILMPEDVSREDGFGGAVAVLNQGLAVGAPGDGSGRVYRYTRNAAGNWQLLESLTSPDDQPGQRFGAVVASSGEWLAVGAPYSGVDGEDRAGRVYLYRCPAGQACELAARLNDPAPEADARFGIALAVTGRWLAVGSVARDVVQFKGAVVPKSGVDAQNFAIAKGDAPFCGEDVGAVFVYSLEALRQGERHPAHALAPPDAECLQQFGAALALEGEVLAVGSPAKDVGDKLFSGVVYVYRFNQGTWEEDVLLASDKTAEDGGFGSRMALKDGRLLVGAPGETAARFRSGAAYVFAREAGHWHTQSRLFLPEGKPHDRFGSALAMTGEEIFIGAPGRDPAGHKDHGAVYLTGAVNQAVSGQYDFKGETLILDPVKVAGQNRYYRARLARDGTVSGFRFTVMDLREVTSPTGKSAFYFPASGRVHIPDLEVIFSDGSRRRYTVDLGRAVPSGVLTFQLLGVR